MTSHHRIKKPLERRSATVLTAGESRTQPSRVSRREIEPQPECQKADYVRVLVLVRGSFNVVVDTATRSTMLSSYALHARGGLRDPSARFQESPGPTSSRGSLQ